MVLGFHRFSTGNSQVFHRFFHILVFWAEKGHKSYPFFCAFFCPVLLIHRRLAALNIFLCVVRWPVFLFAGFGLVSPSLRRLMKWQGECRCLSVSTPRLEGKGKNFSKGPIFGFFGLFRWFLRPYIGAIGANFRPPEGAFLTVFHGSHYTRGPDFAEFPYKGGQVFARFFWIFRGRNIRGRGSSWLYFDL